MSEDAFGRTMDHIQHEVFPNKMKDIELEFDLSLDDLKLAPSNENLSKEFQMEKDDDEDEPNNVDKLEDQFIDHNGSPTHQDDKSLDETLQRTLEERANQIGDDSFQSIPKKPVVNFHYTDQEDLLTEINDWFDIQELNKHDYLKVAGKFEREFDTKFHNDSSLNSQKELIFHLIEGFENCQIDKDRGLDDSLDYLLYISFGAFKQSPGINSQLKMIKKNNKLLFTCGVLPVITDVLIQMIDSKCELKNEKVRDITIFPKCLTLLYLMLLAFIDSDFDQSKLDFIDELSKIDILSKFIEFIDVWRWSPKREFKIRNILSVVWKLILLEFGGTNELHQTKEFLNKKNGIVKSNDPGRLTLSPLDYVVFRDDLISRYPGFTPLPPSNVQIASEYKLEHSNSLSKYIENPRPIKTHASNSQLPTPEIHIVTPAPSPPSIPHQPNKPKKMFQMNQSYPFIYPVSDDESDNKSIYDNDQRDENYAPFAILEANELVYNRVYTKLSDEQLWDMRDKFMKQERGWVNDLEEDEIKNKKEDTYQYDSNTIREFPEYSNQIKSLIRIEDFYGRNLSNFNSLIITLIEVIKSNNMKYEFNEISDITYKNKLQLEMIAKKEITLKAASSIMILLLKWFKRSHVCKYMYIATILFDNQIIEATLHFMQSQNYNDYDKLINPAIRIPEFEFFNYCQELPSSKLPVMKLTGCLNQDNLFMINTIDTFNWRYCFILYNLTSTLKNILLDKTQRILTLCGNQPTETFRNILNKYEIVEIYKPILKTIKQMIPFQGKKWKSSNMDIISLIYLQLRLKLKDNWLSGGDVGGEMRDAYAQEVAIRALLQYYNIYGYGDSMMQMGYSVAKNSYYVREMDSLSEWNN